MSKEVVGFVGLGAMGSLMAASLVRRGFSVVGFDVDASRLQAATTAGIHALGSNAEVATASDRALVLMVQDYPQAAEAVFGPLGISAGARNGLILMVTATMSPASIRQLEMDVSHRGLRLVDAPVTGGRSAAAAGELTIIAAGDDDSVAVTRGIMLGMASRVVPVANLPGVAQAAKLANQAMLAVNMLGVAEALRAAATEGIDETILMDLVASATGKSWVTDHWAAVSSFWKAHNIDGVRGTEIDLIAKDLRHLLDHVEEQNCALPVTSLALDLIGKTW
jgi:3-hydroxyisobutyrate dehydrogenase